MRDIKEILLDEDNLEKILEHYGYENIHKTNKEIRCARGDDSNPTAIRIRLNDNLTSQDFARNISGDIFTLIMSHKGLEFKEVIQEIKSILGLSLSYKKKTKSAFFTLFGRIKNQKSIDIDIEVYPEETLEKYENVWNERFLKDNISIQTQNKFNIGYCNTTNRITIPWRNTNGEIVGVMGRDNTDLAEGFKYLPLIAFPKSMSLYGYSENYINLLNANKIYIFESEKSVLQAHTMGYYSCLALGGNALSDYQIKNILKLNPKEIILGFDEGLDYEIIQQRINSIKGYLVLRECKIGIIHDINNKYIEKGSKCSPTDMGKEVFKKLIQECIYYK